MSGQHHHNKTAIMHQSILEELGLSPNEAKIYETLIEHGESSVSDIAIAAKIHRRNAYDALERLIDKGLCFQILSTAENHYNAVEPTKLTEILAEKKEKLEKALPSLNKKFAGRYAPEEAYIYRGLEGQKNIWLEMLKSGKDIMNLGAKAQWFDPRLDIARDTFFKEAKHKKIKFYILFDGEINEQVPKFAKDYPAIVEYRFLPKKYSTNSVMNIFGDYVVSYTGVGIKKIHDDMTFFIIHSKSLAESYHTWFWYMWDLSSKKH